MSDSVTWWVVMQVVGLAALPLCLTFFRFLPDRGYTLSKAFGLIILGYLFWILNVSRILPNVTGAIWLALILIALGSALLLRSRRDEIVALLKERSMLILATEVLFLLGFAAAAYLRSYVPEISATEKPMDFMYLNAVTHGGDLPPEDPWLAGHNISYYYFGYLLVSIVTRMSGVETAIGFNLGLAMIVALAMTCAFGLVYNLTAPREKASVADEPADDVEPAPSEPPPRQDLIVLAAALATGIGTVVAAVIAYRSGDAGAALAAFLLGPFTLLLLGLGSGVRVPWRPFAFGLVAALLLAVMGNLEGILEALASQNVGAGHGFWGWANIKPDDLVQPYESARWWPDQHIFWWRATRILDTGTGIHEFPFFSFLLGDLHPHVMAIPFVLLAAGLALNFLRSDEPLDVVVWLQWPLWLVGSGIILGGLAFLNTWDLPTMAFVVTLAALLRNRINAGSWSWGLALDTAGFVLPLFLVAFLAYTPFFFGGFSSQASGFTAEASAGSGLFHTFLIWGTFGIIVLPYAVWRIVRSEGKVTLEAAAWALVPALAVVLLWVSWDALATLFEWLPRNVQPNEPGDGGLTDRLQDRGWNWLTVGLMGGAIALLGLALLREVAGTRKGDGVRLGHVFALALSGTAALLIFGTEFFYIQDVFSSRLNTIFKLYYQAWILLSVAGGFVLYELSRSLRLPKLDTLTGVQPGIEAAVVGGATLAGVIAGAVVGGDWFSSAVGALATGGAGFMVTAPLFLIWRRDASALAGGVGAFAAILLAYYAWSVADGHARVIVALVGTPIMLGYLAAFWRVSSPQEDAPASPGLLSWRGVWAGAALVVLLAALVYPLLATYNRTTAFEQSKGLNGLISYNENDLRVIDCLEGVGGRPVIAEALGNSYSQAGRISGATGLPTVLEWPGHQRQWRGSDAPSAGRAEDLEVLYTGTSAEAKMVIDKYGIQFVVVGELERQTYPALTVPDMTEVFEPVTTCNLAETALYRVHRATELEATR